MGDFLQWVMNAIRSSLQRQLFQVDDERLSAVVSIVRVDGKKKKRPAYLCLALSAEHPISVRLYLVKSNDERTYKKKERFQLRDVKGVDGVNPRKSTADFSMTIVDRTYKFEAATPDEKDAFIRQLYKLSSKYLPVQMADFTNVPLPVDENLVIAASAHAARGGPGRREEDASSEAVAYQPISAKEEADFRRLIGEHGLRFDQAHVFATKLNAHLQSLDGANIESMMSSEASVNKLLSVLQSTLTGVGELDREFEVADGILGDVRESVNLIDEKDSLTVVEKRNKGRLGAEAQELVANLEVLTSHHLKTLSEANISNPASIASVVEAAHAVSRFVHGTIPKALLQMRAYQEQAAKLQILDLFVDRLMSHLSALFNNLAELGESGQDWHSLSIPKQSQRHRALAPLADLMGWLKTTRPVVYQAGIDRYFEATRRMYKRLFDRFFDVVCAQVGDVTGGGGGGGGQADRRSSTGGANDSFGTTAPTLTTLIETVLGELNPVITAEQKFCTRFFHVNADLHALSDTVSNDSGDSGSIGVRSVDRHITEQVRNMMQPMFNSLDANLDRFSKACCKYNRSNILLLFVLMSRKVLSSTEVGSYYAVTFGSLVVLIKRQFDVYMESESQALADVRYSKRTRIGILPTIERFAALCQRAEIIFEGAERRTDLEKWYLQLVRSVMDGIERAATSPHTKSPSSVVRFENYHQLYMTLSELKIACLDAHRKEAKKRKEDNIDMYVREHMERPLEKIHVFFDAVRRAMEQGIRAEEIAYQQQLSKMELKKVIAQYPGKEVRRGLESLYKKLEKHLVDSSSLLQVVWRGMQEAFIKQLQSYSQTMAECYPSSKIELEVSVQDVLNYFSDIAQSH